jgi:hypothetical protein
MVRGIHVVVSKPSWTTVHFSVCFCYAQNGIALTVRHAWMMFIWMPFIFGIGRQQGGVLAHG